MGKRSSGAMDWLRLTIFIFLAVVMTSFLAGCKTLPSYPLDVEELDRLIAEKERTLSLLEEYRDQQIQEKGAPDPLTQEKIEELRTEISQMVRLRRRLINLERSGRISGPI